MRPGQTQTGMNLYRYEIFGAVYMKPGRNAWCLVSGQNDMFCLINIWLTQKQVFRPGLRFVVIYMRTVRTQVGTRISRLVSATETKSDRSEFIVRPVSCKRIRRNVWRPIRPHTGLSSSRSHVTTPLERILGAE